MVLWNINLWDACTNCIGTFKRLVSIFNSRLKLLALSAISNVWLLVNITWNHLNLLNEPIIKFSKMQIFRIGIQKEKTRKKVVWEKLISNFVRILKISKFRFDSKFSENIFFFCKLVFSSKLTRIGQELGR